MWHDGRENILCREAHPPSRERGFPPLPGGFPPFPGGFPPVPGGFPPFPRGDFPLLGGVPPLISPSKGTFWPLGGVPPLQGEFLPNGGVHVWEVSGLARCQTATLREHQSGTESDETARLELRSTKISIAMSKCVRLSRTAASLGSRVVSEDFPIGKVRERQG